MTDTGTDLHQLDDDDGLGRARHDDLIIEALLQGANNQQAATAAGCSVSKVQRRLVDPLFRRKLTDARKQVQERTLNALAGAGPIGVLALITAARGIDEATGQPVPWTARIQAAKVLADYGAGNVNRFHIDLNPTADENEDEDELVSRLTEYAARHVAELEAAAAVVEAQATEAPAPPVAAPQRAAKRRRA